MWKIENFIIFCLCLLFVFLFHNCAPLAKKGSFEEIGIKVFGSESPQENGEEGDEGKEDNKEDNKDTTNEGDGDKEDDEDKNGEDDIEPVGKEFDGSETPEAGNTPITRKL